VKLAFFGYAWNKALQLDAYMTATIRSLVAAGADVDLYLGGQLSKEYGIYGLKESVSPAKLATFIAAQGYDATISFNNSMLIPEVIGALKGRIATVIVDEPEHLFDYLGVGPFEVFRQDVEIVAMSSPLERRLTAAVEGVGPRLHFMLPATEIDPLARSLAGPRFPISWVASYVGDLNLDQYLQLTAERADFRALTNRCLEIVERDGDLRSVKLEDGADLALIRTLPWRFEYFQAQIQNILTNRARVAVVERLSKHGLALFGNPGWMKLLTHSTAVTRALQSGPSPGGHGELMAVYNASRLSINLPQSHSMRDAVQYRVIDVMGSNALMLTLHSDTSDLYRVFGKDCPVPTYADLDELEALCVRFLDDEEARRALVGQCNALVSSGFSFAERARELLRIVGLEPTGNAQPGLARRVDLALFPA
jgi:hypothetical protein